MRHRFSLLMMLLLSLIACEREERRFRPAPSAASVLDSVQVSGLRPGAGPPLSTPSLPGYYQESAYAVNEGKRLFNQYNCSGCHANGGGGIGPPLMDSAWIYGSEPSNIFSTILAGRPNGMPSFRNRIPEYQAWEIVAYVRSLSGQLPSDVAPARSDDAYFKPAEQSMPTQVPTGITGVPEQKK